jgi:hypothetical protein
MNNIKNITGRRAWYLLPVYVWVLVDPLFHDKRNPDVTICSFKIENPPNQELKAICRCPANFGVSCPYLFVFVDYSIVLSSVLKFSESHEVDGGTQ